MLERHACPRSKQPDSHETENHYHHYGHYTPNTAQREKQNQHTGERITTLKCKKRA